MHEWNAGALTRQRALMAKSPPSHADALLDPDKSPTYPADLTPALQETLAILADLDSQHEEMHLKLEHWSGPEAIKLRFFEQLEARHQREREPLLQRLAQLQERLGTLWRVKSRLN